MHYDEHKLCASFLIKKIRWLVWHKKRRRCLQSDGRDSDGIGLSALRWGRKNQLCKKRPNMSTYVKIHPFPAIDTMEIWIHPKCFFNSRGSKARNKNWVFTRCSFWGILDHIFSQPFAPALAASFQIKGLLRPSRVESDDLNIYTTMLVRENVNKHKWIPENIWIVSTKIAW